MKVIILKGLPGSGKSTWAKQWVKDNKNWVRFNNDDTRMMIGNYKRAEEPLILACRDNFILEALGRGYSVVVDNTNLHPKHEQRIRAIASLYKPEIEVKWMDTPLEECIRRDSMRLDKVGEKVIRDMWEKFYVKDLPSGIAEGDFSTQNTGRS